MKNKRVRESTVPLVMTLIVAGWAAGCGVDWANLTASLGGTRAGQRGQIQVVFINNTAHRVVATFGTYDQFDQGSVPDVEQFGPDDTDQTLDGDEVSDVLAVDCGRVFAVGSPRLLELMNNNGDTTNLDEDALREGVAFVDAGADIGENAASLKVVGFDPAKGTGTFAQEVDGLPIVGTAKAFEALLGVDFSCGALLILRLEENDAGGEEFRIDFELIPSETTR